MGTEKSRSEAVKFLERIGGGPLTFGRLLRSIRLGEEASLKEFSRKLKISVQHLSDIEYERRSVSPERASRFAKTLGYSEAQFVELTVQDMINSSGLDLKVKVS